MPSSLSGYSSAPKTKIIFQMLWCIFEGVEKGQNSVHVVVEWPLITISKLTIADRIFFVIIEKDASAVQVHYYIFIQLATDGGLLCEWIWIEYPFFSYCLFLSISNFVFNICTRGDYICWSKYYKDNTPLRAPRISGLKSQI